MKLIATTGIGSDETSAFDVISEAKTVGGFMQEVMQEPDFRFGEFEFENMFIARIDYKHGEPTSVPMDVAKMPIKRIIAAGGWGRMDFRIYV